MEKVAYAGIMRATMAAGPTDISAEVPRIEYINTGINEEYNPIIIKLTTCNNKTIVNIN